MSTPWIKACVFLATARFAVAAVDLNREIVLTPPTTSISEDAAIVRWQERAAGPGGTAADFERLGWAFVAKARRTLDAGYYKLAEKTADVMDARFGATHAASLLRGHVDHNLHRFHEAEEIARKLVEERGQPEDYALLSDALMEQGKLGDAVAALQRMADLKPGAEVDTRIAHVRWLKGDLPGAIGAMEAAVRETSPDDRESAAWMLTRLAAYALQGGDTARAETLAASALRHIPDYAPALLMQGRVRLADHHVSAALPLLARAAALNPLPEYEWCLREAEVAAGDVEPAAKIDQELQSRAAVADPRTYSIYLTTRCLCDGDRRRADSNPADRSLPRTTAGQTADDSRTAVRLARAEFATRQDLYTHDALAWALFASGEIGGAEAEIRAALAEHTPDSRLLLHGAVIASAAGRIDDARALLARCRSVALLPSEQMLLMRVAHQVAEPGAMPPAVSPKALAAVPKPFRDPKPTCSLNTQ